MSKKLTDLPGDLTDSSENEIFAAAFEPMVHYVRNEAQVLYDDGFKTSKTKAGMPKVFISIFEAYLLKERQRYGTFITDYIAIHKALRAFAKSKLAAFTEICELTMFGLQGFLLAYELRMSPPKKAKAGEVGLEAAQQQEALQQQEVVQGQEAAQEATQEAVQEVAREVDDMAKKIMTKYFQYEFERRDRAKYLSESKRAFDNMVTINEKKRDHLTGFTNVRDVEFANFLLNYKRCMPQS